MTKLNHMFLVIFSLDFTAEWIVGARNHCLGTFLQMFLNVTLSHNLIAVFVGTSYWKLHDQASNWDVWLQLTYYSLITERTLSGLADTVSTKQVAATRGLYSILKNVQANRAQPSIIWKTTRREIAKFMLNFYRTLAWGLWLSSIERWVLIDKVIIKWQIKLVELYLELASVWSWHLSRHTERIILLCKFILLRCRSLLISQAPWDIERGVLRSWSRFTRPDLSVHFWHR